MTTINNHYKPELMSNAVYKLTKNLNHAGRVLGQWRFEDGVIYAENNKKIQIGYYTSDGSCGLNLGNNALGWGVSNLSGKIHFEVDRKNKNDVSRIFLICENGQGQYEMQNMDIYTRFCQSQFEHYVQHLEQLKETEQKLIEELANKQKISDELATEQNEVNNEFNGLFQELSLLQDKKMKSDEHYKQQIHKLQANKQPFINEIESNKSKINHLVQENKILNTKYNEALHTQNKFKKQLMELNDPDADIMQIKIDQIYHQQKQKYYNRYNQQGRGYHQRGRNMRGYNQRGRNMRGYNHRGRNMRGRSGSYGGVNDETIPICKFYKFGCKRGTSCRFRHVDEESDANKEIRGRRGRGWNRGRGRGYNSRNNACNYNARRGNNTGKLLL
eukprot:234401_1